MGCSATTEEGALEIIITGALEGALVGGVRVQL